MISNPKVQAAITFKSLNELSLVDMPKDMQLEIGYLGYKVKNKSTGHLLTSVGSVDTDTTIKVVSFASDDLNIVLQLANDFQAIPTSVKATIA